MSHAILRHPKHRPQISFLLPQRAAFRSVSFPQRAVPPEVPKHLCVLPSADVNLD